MPVPFRPRDVKAAYATTGFIPVHDGWIFDFQGQTLACGLCAIIAHRQGREAADKLRVAGKGATELAAAMLDVKPGTIRAFRMGFDGAPYDQGQDDVRAYRAGQKSASHVGLLPSY